MILSTLWKFMYPPPNLFVTIISLITFGSMVNSGLLETKGKHMQYSKWWNAGVDAGNKPKIASKNGMILGYTPAWLAGVASFVLLPSEDLRFFLLRSALFLHFFKRIFEVLFVHKYSGFMDKETAITISLSYLMYSIMVIYSQYSTQSLPEPPIDLKYIGVLLFLLGITGNFYHHYLLSRLRTKGDKNYKIPQGGLFSLVICPHYLFEIIGFLGISCISQTVYPFCFALGSAGYLMGRSWATRKWYQSKFEDFPTNVKALIPFVF